MNGRGMMLAVLLVGEAMATMDGSIVVVALPGIGRDLHASGGALQMIAAGYTLAMAVLVVTGARLGDLYRHRRMFLAGLACFTAASLASGLAPSAGALIAGRAVQGASAALLLPQVLSIVQIRFTGEARRRALGLYSMVLALGVAAGQVAGGVIVSMAGWRPVFLVNVPIGLVLLACGPRSLPRGEAAKARLDIGGVAILVAAMTALVLPLVMGRESGWPAWTWLCLTGGVLGLAAFRRYERRVAAPVLDLAVLRLSGVRWGLLACWTVMGCYAALVFCLSLYVQTRLGFSALRSGLSFLPYPAGFALAGLGWAKLPARWHRALPPAGLLALAAVAPLIALSARGGWSYPLTVPLLFVGGAGHAGAFSPLVTRVAAAAGLGRASAVSALTNTGTLLANVLAVAILGGLYLSHGGLLWATVPMAALLAVAAASVRPARPVRRAGARAPARPGHRARRG